MTPAEREELARHYTNKAESYRLSEAIADTGELRDFCRSEAELAERTAAALREPVGRAGRISADDIEWIVNDNGELGVKVGDTFAFLYKGHSLEYSECTHDDGTLMRWRNVYKREFGECCHPFGFSPTREGLALFRATGEGDWRAMREAPASEPVGEPASVEPEMSTGTAADRHAPCRRCGTETRGLCGECHQLCFPQHARPCCNEMAADAVAVCDVLRKENARMVDACRELKEERIAHHATLQREADAIAEREALRAENATLRTRAERAEADLAQAESDRDALQSKIDRAERLGYGDMLDAAKEPKP